MAPAWLPALLVALAIGTDYGDGIIARRRGTSSPRGMLFDHTTDFLFVTSGLAGAAVAGLLPALLPALIVVAFSQYGLDSYLLYRDRSLRMSALGRWNGILYFVPLVMIAMSRIDELSLLGDLAGWLARPFAWLLVLSTVASIVDRGLAPFRARGSVR